MVKISEEDMLFSWGFAEIDGKHERCGGFLRKEIADRVTASGPNSCEDVKAVIAAIRLHRGPLLLHLVGKGANWYEADFPIERLPEVHLIVLDELGNAKTIPELARLKPDIGKKDFRPEKMRGLPIYVSEKVGGPWRLFEGQTRSLELFRMAQKRELSQTTFRIIVGIFRVMPLKGQGGDAV